MERSSASNKKDLLREVFTTIKEFKSFIIIGLVWIVIGEVSGYSLFYLVVNILNLVLYPVKLLLVTVFPWLGWEINFYTTGVPQAFILLVPLLFLFVIGFILLISTED
ncbi:MAG: hypothetical protein ACTSP4_12485 [Candidatus Hodarchaeales archaeon]